MRLDRGPIGDLRLPPGVQPRDRVDSQVAATHDVVPADPKTPLRVQDKATDDRLLRHACHLRHRHPHTQAAEPRPQPEEDMPRDPAAQSLRSISHLQPCASLDLKATALPRSGSTSTSGRPLRPPGTGASYVLTTGTGSGKSLAYIVPIVDRVLRAKQTDQRQRVRAIIVYPMNALAISQIGELQRFLRDGYPAGGSPVTFERYTGQEDQEDRDRIRANPAGHCP